VKQLSSLKKRNTKGQTFVHRNRRLEETFFLFSKRFLFLGKSHPVFAEAKENFEFICNTNLQLTKRKPLEKLLRLFYITIDS